MSEFFHCGQAAVFDSSGYCQLTNFQKRPLQAGFRYGEVRVKADLRVAQNKQIKQELGVHQLKECTANPLY